MAQMLQTGLCLSSRHTNAVKSFPLHRLYLGRLFRYASAFVSLVDGISTTLLPIIIIICIGLCSPWMWRYALIFVCVCRAYPHKTDCHLCSIWKTLTFRCLVLTKGFKWSVRVWGKMYLTPVLFLVFSLCVQAVYKCLLDRVPEEQKDTNVQ